MYAIYRLPDGRFECHGRLQDGTERWVEDTLDAAAIRAFKADALDV